jgi:zinc-binding alcohol dehydrogenase family protein
MFGAGKLKVEIEDILTLEEAAKAHEQAEAGHTPSKTVLRVGRARISENRQHGPRSIGSRYTTVNKCARVLVRERGGTEYG